MAERVTLITGASAGIGADLARIFAEDFDKVAIRGRVNFKKSPDDNKDDEDESPEVISVHGGLGCAGFAGAFADFGYGAFGDFQFGVRGTD